MSNDDEFGALFDDFKKVAFRLETVTHYEMDDERDALTKYLAGEPLPQTPGNPEWVEFITEAKAAGKQIQRVRCMPSVPTPYLRFELEWGFLYYARAGEDIRILETDDPDRIFGENPSYDYWLFDNEAVGQFAFDKSGRFEGVTVLRDSDEVVRYNTSQEIALKNSIPLRDYLARQRSAT